MYTSVQGPRTLFELVKDSTKRHSPQRVHCTLNYVRMCIMVCILIQDWEDYGIDWAGPVPHGCPNENTVTVDEVTEMLSVQQKACLDR